MHLPIRSTYLGQSGFRLQFNDTVIYIDPYLSDSVAEIEGEHLHRLLPIPVKPGDVNDADWILITHIHLDHCDLATLKPIYDASPLCRFAGTSEVCTYLIKNGFSEDRVIFAQNDWFALNDYLRIHATPAAHPTIVPDGNGAWQSAGYMLDFGGYKMYHSGDSFVVQELIDFLLPFAPFDIVLLPVNEHNYFREKQNIIGNMSIRDAFGLAEVLQAKKMIPIHWDMFQPNRVFKEEIELLYKLLNPPFELIFNPTEL